MVSSFCEKCKMIKSVPQSFVKVTQDDLWGGIAYSLVCCRYFIKKGLVWNAGIASRCQPLRCKLYRVTTPRKMVSLELCEFIVVSGRISTSWVLGTFSSLHQENPIHMQAIWHGMLKISPAKIFTCLSEDINWLPLVAQWKGIHLPAAGDTSWLESEGSHRPQSN